MNGPRWYDRAVEQIERDFESGDIDLTDYNAELRALNNELRDAADEQAEQARDEYMGGW